jgi:putative redox protein
MTAKRPPNAVRTTWAGGYRFDTGRPGGPIARIDGDGETGQSPPDALLSALASCSGIDVVDILAKRRTPVETLTIDVEGERRDDIPRRFTRLTLTYALDGAGVEALHAERAVALAFEKYCSVAASLAPDTVVETIVIVNGVRGTPVSQRIAD